MFFEKKILLEFAEVLIKFAHVKFFENKIYVRTLFLCLCVALASCSSDADKALDYYNKAQSLYNEGDYHRSSVQLKNALKKDESLADAYFMQAKIFQSWREWKTMYAFLLKTLEYAPQHVEANIMLAKVFVEAGKFERAKEPMTVLSTLATEHPTFLMLKGAIYLHENNYDKALSFANRSLDKLRENRDAILLKARVLEQSGDVAGAIDFLRVQAGLMKSQSAILIELARLQMVQGHVEGATNTWIQLIENEPGDISYRFRLAALLAEKGSSQEAENVLRKAVQDNPDSVDAKLGLANYLGRMDYRQAIEVLLTYMPKNNVDPELKIALGEYYEQGGDAERASAVYKSLFSQAENVSIAANAGTRLANLALREDKQREAISLISQVLAKEHNHADALTMRAVINLWQRNTDAAITDLQIVLREQPKAEVALLLLAQAQLQSSNRILARNALEKLLVVNPTNETGVLLMAQILSQEGSQEEARELLESYLLKRGASLAAMEALTEQYLRLGEWSKAKKIARNAVKVGASELMPQLVDAEIARRTQRFDVSNEIYITLLNKKLAERESTLGLLANARMQGKLNAMLVRLESILSDTDSDLLRELTVREYLSLKQTGKAQALVEERKRLDHKWAQRHALLAEIAAQRGDLAIAESEARQYLLEHENDTTMRLFLANIYEQRGATEEAIQIYREILSYTPSNDLAANNLANLLANDSGTLGEAMAWAKRFEYTANPNYRDTLAMIYYQQGDYHRAAMLMRKVVGEHDHNPVFHRHLGQILLALSDKTGARLHFEQALVLFGDNGDEIQREETVRLLRNVDAAAL